MNTIEQPQDRRSKYVRPLAVELSRHGLLLFRTRKGRPACFGSATLLMTRSYPRLLPAADVLDSARAGDAIFYYVEKGLTQTIAGECIVTLPEVGESHNDDRLDVAVVHLQGLRLPPYPAVNKFPIGIDALRPYALPRHNKEYLIVGFPASKAKTKVAVGGGIVRLRPYVFRNGSVSDSAYEGLGIDPRVHIAVDFNQREVVADDGSRREAPNPDGMSGSPLWMIHSEHEHIDPLNPPIVGILIERRKKDRVLIATDVAVALKA